MALVDNPDPFVAYWAALGHVRRRQVYIAVTGQVSVQTFPGLICRIRAAQRMASVVKP